MHLYKCKYKLTLAFENKPYHVVFVMLHPKISPSNHYLDLNSWKGVFPHVYILNIYIYICTHTHAYIYIDTHILYAHIH